MKKRSHRQEKNQPANHTETPKPFIEHLHELRRRVIYSVASILLFSTGAYFVQQYIVSFLLKPSQGQKFIYTSPGGGISFLFSVCMYVGIAASLPIIIYQTLAFLEPLLEKRTRRIILRYTFFSILLAGAGFGFGYFIGLPTALHFLSHQFTNNQIHPLLTIQEYLSFLTVYLLGAMMLFQVPIVLLFINRIRPLGPRGLFKAERYVIVAAFIISMIMVPTPNVVDQLIIAGPVILMYNVSIALIAIKNRRGQRLERRQLVITPPPSQPTTQLRDQPEPRPASVPAAASKPKPMPGLPLKHQPSGLRLAANGAMTIMDIIPPTKRQAAV